MVSRASLGGGFRSRAPVSHRRALGETRAGYPPTTASNTTSVSPGRNGAFSRRGRGRK